MPAMAGGERSFAATGYAGRRSARGYVPTLKHVNDQMLLPQDFPSRGGRPAPPGGRFGAGRVSGEEQQPFGAEPGGGVRNREQGASCLSAASSCPAGSAARRPGSSQRQGCPFAVVWRRPHDGFFSLGRQRKERRPARGRCHLSDAGASGQRSHAGAWERSYDHGPRQAQ